MALERAAGRRPPLAAARDEAESESPGNRQESVRTRRPPRGLVSGHRKGGPMTTSTAIRPTPARTLTLADIPPPPPPRPVEWRRGLAALRELLAEPRAHRQGLRGVSVPRRRRRGADLPAVSRRARRSRAWRPRGRRCWRGSRTARRWRALPDGSFGRAYLDYLDRTGLDPVGLVEAQVRARRARQARWGGSSRCSTRRAIGSATAPS